MDLPMTQLYSMPACWIFMRLESGSGGEGWLLGDRGYALTPVIMTPFHPVKMTSNAERKYQKAHTKTRNVIERSLGVLKQRFKCLDFFGGAMEFAALVDAAKSSLQQPSYTTCVSLIIPSCQKPWGPLTMMIMIMRRSIMSHQAPVVLSQWDKNWVVMYFQCALQWILYT